MRLVVFAIAASLAQARFPTQPSKLSTNEIAHQGSIEMDQDGLDDTTKWPEWEAIKSLNPSRGALHQFIRELECTEQKEFDISREKEGSSVMGQETSSVATNSSPENEKDVNEKTEIMPESIPHLKARLGRCFDGKQIQDLDCYSEFRATMVESLKKIETATTNKESFVQEADEFSQQITQIDELADEMCAANNEFACVAFSFSSYSLEVFQNRFLTAGLLSGFLEMRDEPFGSFEPYAVQLADHIYRYTILKTVNTDRWAEVTPEDMTEAKGNLQKSAASVENLRTFWRDKGFPEEYLSGSKPAKRWL